MKARKIMRIIDKNLKFAPKSKFWNGLKSCVRKQVPMRVDYEIDFEVSEILEDALLIRHCPVCDSVVGSITSDTNIQFNYCPECGQKLRSKFK